MAALLPKIAATPTIRAIVGQRTSAAREKPTRGHGAMRPRQPDQASIHGTHRGLRPSAAITGRTHDRKRPAVRTGEKVLASRRPSTHVLGPRIKSVDRRPTASGRT